MARSAASRSFSLRPEEAPRFDDLVKRMAHGSPTEFVRRAMDRMEALENWQLFLEVREVGFRRAQERGGSTSEQRRAAVKRALNASPPSHQG